MQKTQSDFDFEALSKEIRKLQREVKSLKGKSDDTQKLVTPSSSKPKKEAKKPALPAYRPVVIDPDSKLFEQLYIKYKEKKKTFYCCSEAGKDGVCRHGASRPGYQHLHPTPYIRNVKDHIKSAHKIYTSLGDFVVH